MRRSPLGGSVGFGLMAVGAAVLLTVGPRDARAGSVTVELRAAPVPAIVELPAGETLVWHNVDTVRHRVRSVGRDDEFDSGDLEPGETYAHTFGRAGTFVYVDRRKEQEASWIGTVVVGDPAAPSTPTQSPGASPPVSAGPAFVDVRDFAFTPAGITVGGGATVTFRNTGAAAHTVTARDGSFDRTLAAGASTAVTFSNAGTFAYYCKFHPSMVGSITVVAAAAAGGAAPAPDIAATPAPVKRSSPSASARPARKGGIAAALHDFRFAPAVLRVRTGRAVTWTNRGAAPHSVTAVNASFDSGVLSPGASWRHVFRRKGVYQVVCSLHPQMRATVVVRPSRPRPKRRPPARPAKRNGIRSRAGS